MQRFELKLGGSPYLTQVFLDGERLDNVSRIRVDADHRETSVQVELITARQDAVVQTHGYLLNEQEFAALRELLDFLKSGRALHAPTDVELTRIYHRLEFLELATQVAVRTQVVA